MFGPNGLISYNDCTHGTLFYAFDERGNVAERTNSSGTVLSNDLYDAFGQKLSGNPGGDPMGFGAQAGYRTDAETGLCLLTHRYYDPAQGWFVTRDPIGYDGGINLYSYTQNNPGNEMDPMGLFGWHDVLDIMGNGLERGISIGGSGWFVTGGGGFDVGIATDQSGTFGITYDFWGGSGLGTIGLGGAAGAFFSPSGLGKPDLNGTVQYSHSFDGVAASLPIEPFGGGSITGSPNSLPTLQINTPGRPYYVGAVTGHSGFLGLNPWACLSSLITGKSQDYFSPGGSSCKQY